MMLLILGGGIVYSTSREYNHIEALERERLATNGPIDMLLTDMDNAGTLLDEARFGSIRHLEVQR